MENLVSASISVNIKKKVFKDTNKKIPDHVAIENLFLKIPKAEFCTLIGPSGCGKTTLLNLISGIDKSLEGTIDFEGKKNINAIKLAYMFQSPRLLPWLNVLENVEIILDKEQKKNNRAKDILQIMGLEKFLFYYPQKLSGGMQRRVALARSFASKPELFILDEPFVSLDEPAANSLREMLLNLWTKEPTTIIFITHDLKEAIYLSDRIIFLSKPPAKVLKEKRILLKRPRDFYSPEIENIKIDILSKNKLILKGMI